MSLEQLINDIPKLLAYLICLGSLVNLFFIFFTQRDIINLDLRGKDKMWQFIELSGIVWLVLFPCVMVCSLLGIEVQIGAWTTLDAIFFMNLGGKMGLQWMNKQPDKNEKTDKTGIV
jgi:hypothetical protein